MLQEATVNLPSSSTTYGTLFGPAPETGTGLWHLIFHFDNGWLPVATVEPVRVLILEGQGRLWRQQGGYEDVCSKAFPGWVRCNQLRVWDPWGVNYYLSYPANSLSSIILGWHEAGQSSIGSIGSTQQALGLRGLVHSWYEIALLCWITRYKCKSEALQTGLMFFFLLRAEWIL